MLCFHGESKILFQMQESSHCLQVACHTKIASVVWWGMGELLIRFFQSLTSFVVSIFRCLSCQYKLGCRAVPCTDVGSVVQNVPWPSLSSCRVFGAGYPGLPTMTVNDWYDQKRREEAARGQTAPQRPPSKAEWIQNGNRELGSSLEGKGEWECIQDVKHPLAFSIGFENKWLLGCCVAIPAFRLDLTLVLGL